ncbi:MAG TPA: hypothetical protein VK169_08760 [Saprospiraceae bacterium]|nr:hypothetical protein [Saprospiraceae bacterium]
MGRIEKLKRNQQLRKVKSLLRSLFVIISIILICVNFNNIIMLIFQKSENVIKQPKPIIHENEIDVLSCDDIIGRYKRIKNRKAQVLLISDFGSRQSNCSLEIWLEHDKSKKNEIQFNMHKNQINLFDNIFHISKDGGRIILTNVNDNQDVFRKD